MIVRILNLKFKALRYLLGTKNSIVKERLITMPSTFLNLNLLGENICLKKFVNVIQLVFGLKYHH